MIDTIIEYLKKYGEYTFSEKPMNDVDSLVLCQFSYLKFDGIVPLVTENRKPVLLRNLPRYKNFNNLFADKRYEKQNRALFDAMLCSKRYRNLKINNYINIVETDWETQFSAVTFLPEGCEIYVAYRGTDETIVGWKEDFNMAFQTPIPGQAYAVKYLYMVAEKITGSFYVGGHSKGGNLAVYATMNSTEEVQERILKIYSMDGPGFRKEILEKSNYEAIKDRIVKILPQSSVVGMLFETAPSYKVVASKTLGMLQHNPYTWIVKDDDFYYVKDIHETRKFADDVVNEWVTSLDEEERRLLVDTLYQVVSASEAENLIDFSSDWKKSLSGMVAAIKEVDGETKKILKTLIKEFFEIVGEGLKAKIYDKRE
ncbi:MAG: DUF2974 domain-containing protein [Lachnospiraceae bacterium]|nr:DUF2974 domain-containing protein [Lachnospiraceae bacterium]